MFHILGSIKFKIILCRSHISGPQCFEHTQSKSAALSWLILIGQKQRVFLFTPFSITYQMHGLQKSSIRTFYAATFSSQFSNSEMLRLNLHGSIVPNPVENNNSSRSCRSWIILSNKPTIVCRRIISVKALKDGMNGGTNGSGLGGRNWDPGLEIEVPFEQRPVCMIS